MVAATTEKPVTISMVPVTLDVMKGWKATCVRKNVNMDITVKIAITPAVKTATCPDDVTRLQANVTEGVRRAGTL